eukprot:GFUD01022928.1.p1 GENE.GFUD01022928.1~~GFUD01022928.1.p1  ORF type:complete len:394 (+),score=58.36 GFUD01022928.1:105-1184(+)
MLQPNCSALHLPLVVGPDEVFSSMGHWSTAVYIILGLHAVPVWLVGTLLLLRLAKLCPPALFHNLAWLISVPPVLMFLTTLAILLPSVGKYVEVLLEVVLCVGLVKFLKLTITLCGGKDSLVSYCADRDILLPVGSPPLVCFLPCTKPSITKYRLSCIMLGPSILLGLKVVILAVDLIYLLIDYTPSGDFLGVDNIHNLASFPIGLGAIYSLNIYLVIINECLPSNTKRLLGLVLVLEFILFDCLRLFFIFLTGSGMLTCIAPYLSQDTVVHLLKNIIKAFLATFMGIPYLQICAEKMELPQLPDPVVDTKANLGVVEIHYDEHHAELVKQEHDHRGQHEHQDQDVYSTECGLDLQRSI